MASGMAISGSAGPERQLFITVLFSCGEWGARGREYRSRLLYTK